MNYVLAGWWTWMSLVWVSAINAQSLEEYSTGVPPIVRGLSVYALENERNFPVIVRDSLDHFGLPVRSRNYITIQFDVLATEPPPLKIRFLHCDRNWLPDDNVFVQDENHNTSFYLEFRTSPGGVAHYRYRYKNRFPDEEGIVRFNYSGNWIFKVMDEDETTVFAEGRFFVVDNSVPTDVTVTNEFLTTEPSPLNQVHKIDVRVQLPNEIEGYFFTTVDVYQNRRFHHLFRIETFDEDPFTVVEGFNTGFRFFTITDVHPGNEYRTLDLSNTTRYPNRSVVRLVEGADQQRNYWRTGPDSNGTAFRERFTGINSDYLEVFFRLDLADQDFQSVTAGGKDIYLVGPFNDWEPTLDDKLAYDKSELSFVNRKLLRRGIYDYQYVTGAWSDSVQGVIDQDWLALEGNDWRTSNTYAVMVYFNDPRFGGFDRIVGFARGVSSPLIHGSY
ncbi:MAG: DUF5103 domain-containing protein [Ignavibacteria bacterium]|nr:DUF5103 domain-containing protein [Ignavibacteria bacterium]